MSDSSHPKQELKKLYQELEAAAPSLPLATTAEDIVPGEGACPAEILCIGEAPGFNEAQQRRPFVGRSGQLLRKTLEEVSFPPETVYITNIVKVRPPENRDPTASEIAAYRLYLNKEITIVDPTLVVTLGRFSMAKFLPDVKISQVHGRLHKVTWEGKVLFVLPMYHPAAALRGTRMKDAFVADFKKIKPILKWIEEHQELEEFAEEIEEVFM